MGRLLALAAILMALSHGAHAATLADLDRAAQALSMELSTAAAALGVSTRTLAIETEPGSVLAPVLKEGLLQRLLETRRFTLLDGPRAPEEAEWIARVTVFELSGASFSSLKVINRKTSEVVSALRHELGPSAPSPGVDKPAPGAARATYRAFRPYGGAFLRGDDIYPNAGIGFRPGGQLWEAAMEMGRYDHSDAHLSPPYNSTSYRTDAQSRVTYFRLKADYLHPIVWERFFRFAGQLKAGGGLGRYSLDHRQEFQTLVTGGPGTDATYTASERIRVLPFLELGLSKEIGAQCELSVLVEYVFSNERFGYRNFTLGGPALQFQLSFRLL